MAQLPGTTGFGGSAGGIGFSPVLLFLPVMYAKKKELPTATQTLVWFSGAAELQVRMKKMIHISFHEHKLSRSFTRQMIADSDG